MSTSTERMRRLRERRAAGLLPAEGEAPRPEDERLAPALEETIAALELKPEDAGVVQLARRYVDVIDKARDQTYAIRWIGPLLLDTLKVLQATPQSRQVVMSAARPPSQLERLRAARSPGRPGAVSTSLGS
jgi:hypothetical protein